MDENFNLRGLITIKDIQKSAQYPNSARDERGRLLCGAAVGVTHDTMERVAALVEAQVDCIGLDTAHGHSEGVLEDGRKDSVRPIPELTDHRGQRCDRSPPRRI